MNILLIAIGGAIGSVLRYLISSAATKLCVEVGNPYLSRFPWGTFSVNIIGSMMAGIAYYFLIKHFQYFDPKLKNFLFVGVLGGFTTFSAFSLDFFRLFTAGQYHHAFIYAFSTITLSLLALFFGFYLMKMVVS